VDDEVLARLLDERAIERVLHRYARSIDRADRDGIVSVFHPDAIDHHGGMDGTPQELAAYAIDSVHSRYLASAHYLTNITVDVVGDVAQSEAYFIGMHLRGEDSGEDPGHQVIDWMGGRYLDRFERRDGEWRIAERTVVQDWDNEQQVRRVDRWRGGVFKQGMRFPDDLVYAR
jgi:hypothetical protein